ncbi:glycosyltransferase [Fragilaria crotonensis]|nr:glycosyltransferase [Fragilaria crotonensis]
MSEFPFNYEYISWRKGYNEMFQREGKDNVQFWLSQLLFRCPVPQELQQVIATQQHVDSNDLSHLFIDVIPIRTAPRVGAFLFTKDHVGDDLLSSLSRFDLKMEFGDQHYLPKAEDSGRWGNIPICRPPPVEKHRLVACTWTASAYTRRGDAVGISDTEARVREWILFHKMVGFDHVYLYDNTAPRLRSSLAAIAGEFPHFVNYHRWPCSICNNNRPTHRNPGERSSQYAAEASCRERYGQSTDWMAFIDTDEYLIPMAHDTWKPLLDHFDKAGTHVLKMRSSRAKPRIEHMTPMKDQSRCVDPVPQSKKPPGGPQQCLEPVHNQTYLQVYNCEFIRPPRPERFERAMKQIYRPDYVQSHFVHYSTVTRDVSKYRKNFGPDERYLRNVHGRDWKEGSPEIFLDELHQGRLVHARSVLPHESQYRDQGCKTGSPYGCDMGYLCPDTTPFVDEKHKENAFVDAEGRYCNCWKNDKVEDRYIPQLNSMVKRHMTNQMPRPL